MGGQSKAQKQANQMMQQELDQQKSLEATQKQEEEEQAQQLLKRKLGMIRQMQGGNGLDNSSTIG